MEKICGVVVFLSVYQLAGMLNYHDAPVLKRYQLVAVCNTAWSVVGPGKLCN